MGKKLKKEKLQVNAVETFKGTARGMGRLRLQPHEAYEEELEERIV